MNIFKKLKKILFRVVINLDKETVFYELRKLYFDGIVRRQNEASQFNWEQFNADAKPARFEDLTGLFFCSPLTRGILRQDIDEAALIFKTVSAISSAKGVEIGRYYGGSTVLCATAIGDTGKLYSIDVSPKNNDLELIKVLQKLGFQDRVSLIVDDANNVNIAEELDFVLIDGDHSYEGARLDHNRWGERLKSGGFLIHHDMACTRPYSVQWSDLKELYQDIQKTQENCLKIVGQAGSMVVFLKTSETWINVPSKTKQETNKLGLQSRDNSYLSGEAKSNKFTQL
ncbi:class I SAM-dependent methyltransferase [Akkermansiaceae bacterium]|nr:class I SAM-dependent methyltransferase [Akkermansiaceae bacterium]